MRRGTGLGAMLLVLLVSGFPAGAHGPIGDIPYRWVDPPAFVRGELNLEPLSAAAGVKVGPQGSEASSLTTGDGQAALVLPLGTFAPRDGVVEVNITPLDPDSVAPPPQGYGFEANAYRVTFSGATGEPRPQEPFTIVLTFARDGGAVLAYEGGTWEELPTQKSAPSRQLLADAGGPGTFVAAVRLPAAEAIEQKIRRAPWWEIALAGGVVVLAGFAIYFLNRPARP